jgi:tricarballylate dehydrogenase
VVLEQPGQFAWQVFDAKVKHMQRDEYRIRQVTKVTADTLEEFANKLEGVNAEQFLKTIAEYNAAVRKDVPFNPNVKDGRRTVGLAIDKHNWANTIDTPPFEGLCGDVRHFLHVRRRAHHHRRRGAQYRLPADPRPLCGRRAGRRLFYFNYPGGSGLTSGAVFGRIAGTTAARAGKN